MMPHDRNGAEVKPGDIVLCVPGGSPPDAPTKILGVIESVSPGSTSCNAQMIPLARRTPLEGGGMLSMVMPPLGAWCITIGDCVKLAALLLAALVMPMGMGGCGAGATRANPIEQTEGSVHSATYATSKFVRVDKGGGTLNIDTNLPTYASRLGLRSEYVRDAAGNVVDVWFVPEVDSAGGGASHEMTVPLGKNQYATLRSASVFTIKADTYEAKADGTVKMTNLAIGSDAAAANVSVAAVVQALGPTWQKWSDDDRQRFETMVSELAKLGSAWGQAALEAVKVLKGVTPAGIVP